MFWAYLKALLRHWRAFALTGAVPAAVGIAASVVDKDVPPVWWLASFGLALVVAHYRVFEETETQRQVLAADLATTRDRQDRRREIRDELAILMGQGDLLLIEFREQLGYFFDPVGMPPRQGNTFLEPTRNQEYREWLSDVREFFEFNPELGMGAAAIFDAVDGLPVVTELPTWDQLRQMAEAIPVRNMRLRELMRAFMVEESR